MNPFTITNAAVVAAAIQAVDELDQGLTLAELVASIPHDISAMVVYAMLVGSALFVWRAGRSTGSTKEEQVAREAGPESDSPPR
jgi:hypothetical protein